MASNKDSHVSVLLQPAIDSLNIGRNDIIVDATLGLAGHTKSILEQYPEVVVIGFDQDQRNIELCIPLIKKFKSRLHIIHDSFASLQEQLEKMNIKTIQGILFDLGVSSPHFDEGERGFSFQNDGPLDMRIDRRTSKTAQDIVQTYSQEKLSMIFREYGEEPYSSPIARHLTLVRTHEPFHTTFSLRNAINDVTPPHAQKKTCIRIFQALRMEVNQELETLKKGLLAAHAVLSPEKRMTVISFHSLEDRIVKQFIQQGTLQCSCPPLTLHCQCGTQPQYRSLFKKPLTPNDNEKQINPRSRSAKMRTVERLNTPYQPLNF